MIGLFRSQRAPVQPEGAEAAQLARRLYTDLLISTLTNSIYEDPSMVPGLPQVYDDENRATGKDWPRTAHSMAGRARLNNLRDLVQQAIDERVPGHFIETGVWRGGCCILMKGVLAANGVTDRRVYVADSFAGLPPADPTKYKDAADDSFHTFKELAIPRSVVQHNSQRYGLLDDNVVFVEGFFQDTLPNLDAGPFAVIRLDGDMYGSTIVALENLYPKLSPGGFVVVDDYALPACREAVTDYRSAQGIDAKIEEIDWTGVWWRKPIRS